MHRELGGMNGEMESTADVCDSELAREKMWSRIHLIPLLTAEEDRDLVRRHLADQAREKELLGSTTSAYNSDRYDSCLFKISNADIGSADTYDLLLLLRRARYRSRYIKTTEQVAWGTGVKEMGQYSGWRK
jgi:hypothetical protein